MRHAAAAIVALLCCAPAAAQSPLSAGAELATDERRRGLSWSDGRPSASADAALSLGSAEASVRVAALRGADRHGGADAVVDAAAGLVHAAGPFQLRAGAIAHLFAGARGRLDYGEAEASAAATLGPLQLTAGARYAPDQRAIGGDNLHLRLDALAGLPGTPWTLSAGIGRSTGDADDPVRAARLRPAGGYTDWRVGAAYALGPLTLALDYVGTDIRRRDAHSIFADADDAGERLVARVRVGL